MSVGDAKGLSFSEKQELLRKRYNQRSLTVNPSDKELFLLSPI